MTIDAAAARRRRISLAIRTAVYLLIAGAFAWFLTTVDWSELRGRQLNVGWLAFALVFGLAFRYFAVVVWRTVLHSLGATDLPRFSQLADIYARAWMGRYIPGKVAWLAAKVYLAAQRGISKSRLAVSTLVEGAAQVVGAGLVSLGLLGLDGRLGQESDAARIAVFLGALGLAALTLPPVFNRAVALGFRILKRGTPPRLSWQGISTSVGLYGAGSLLSGLSNAGLAMAVAPSIGLRDVLFIMGAFGFAGVLGIIAPFVPSGIGVRDGAQYAFLLVIVPAPEALLITVAARVWSALVDLAFFGSARVLGRVRR